MQDRDVYDLKELVNYQGLVIRTLTANVRNLEAKVGQKDWCIFAISPMIRPLLHLGES